MKHYIVVDIDGTLTKVGSRVECLKSNPPDWDSFYARCGEDEPAKPIVDLLRMIQNEYTVVLCSGRRESCRTDTETWLKKHGIDWTYLLLRNDGDFRHDSIVKPEMLERSKIQWSNVAFVLEDRNAMVKKWRELGFVCLQVAEGDF